MGPNGAVPAPTPALPARDLLGLWERAVGLGPVERALALAEAAGADPVALRRQPLGRTNGSVLDLRETLMGPELTATAACPGCAARVEFTLDARVLRAMAPASDGTRTTLGEYVVDWRPPAPDDLIAAVAGLDPVADLRRSCLTVTDSEGRPVDAILLADRDLDAAEAAMAAADPLAEVLVSLACPGCGLGFEADVDPGTFVWAEIDARARLLLEDVDLLARAYGWTEPDVLALTEVRRAAYLRMVRDGAA
jgi:hypothetical protein